MAAAVADLKPAKSAGAGAAAAEEGVVALPLLPRARFGLCSFCLGLMGVRDLDLLLLLLFFLLVPKELPTLEVSI